MHLPHNHTAQIQYSNHENIPCSLQGYAAAIHNFPGVWQNYTNLQNYLHNQGHRNSYIANAISYICSLGDMFFLWQMQIINPMQLQPLQNQQSICFTLDPHQLSVQNHVIRLVNARNAHYNSYSAAEGHHYSSDTDSDISVEEDELCNEFNIDRNNQQQPHAINNCWTKPILLTGKQGVGKTYTILSTVNEVVPTNTKIFVADPTGFLASVYRISRR